MLSFYENRVAIIPLFDPDRIGSIWVPEQAKQRCDQGIVKYCGPECKHVSPGDYVVFPGYSGQSLFIDDEGLLIVMREIDIVAIITSTEIGNTDIPGLYFKGPDGYFTATYEYALEFITKAFQDAEWRKGMKSRDMLDHRPKDVGKR